MLKSNESKLTNPKPIVNIYTLSDPRTPDQVRYVGKTIMPIKLRLNAHINKVKYRKCHSSNWIKSIVNAGLRPVIQLIEAVDEDLWVDKEKYYILRYRELGYNLTNHTEGGEGAPGYKHTEEFKTSRRKPEHLKKKYKARYSSSEERYAAHSSFLKEKYRDNPPFVLTPEQIKKANNASTLKTSKRVLEIAKGIIIAEYPSTATCARQTGLIDASVARVCRGVRKHTQNRYFLYENDVFKPSAK